MRHRLTFFGTLRLLWLGVNVAILIVSISGHRDLSGTTVMLSFPADVVGGLILLTAIYAMGWSETSGLVTLLFGIVAILCGYLQWFVIGRALAERILAWLPTRPLLRVTLRAAIVFVFLGQRAIGVEMVRAQDEAKHYFDRGQAQPVSTPCAHARPAGLPRPGALE